jgi:hypothetical protein
MISLTTKTVQLPDNHPAPLPTHGVELQIIAESPLLCSVILGMLGESVLSLRLCNHLDLGCVIPSKILKASSARPHTFWPSTLTLLVSLPACEQQEHYLTAPLPHSLAMLSSHAYW